MAIGQELLNVPMGDMIRQMAFAIADAQVQLDESSLRVVELMTFRPSRDLGMIAREFEPRLPRAFRLLTRGLGTRETKSPDMLSLMMFQDDYVKRLMEIGEEDAERRGDELAEFLDSSD